ncbi:MAG: response regulator [Patulibacter minatonensis]
MVPQDTATATLAFVEDSDEDFAMYRRVFATSGAMDRWADAESALEAFERGDVVLGELSMLVVDLSLPGMDGCQFIARARALPGGDRPTICVLSSSARASDRTRAAEAGADGYLVKPATLAGLRALPEQMAQIAADR